MEKILVSSMDIDQALTSIFLVHECPANLASEGFQIFF
jgi:hypothetical protein